jgi:putative membrane protein
VSSPAAPLDWTGGPALLWVLGVGLLYCLGGRSTPRRRGSGWRTAAFLGGLAAILAALDSPIDELADELFWVHMVQHVLLIGVAAPLLALSRPWSRIWRGFPLSSRRSLARTVAGPRWAPARAAFAFLTGTLVSWLLFNVSFCVWHLPVLYDAALRLELVHALEHFVFFFTALLFWTRVVPAAPWRSSLSEAGKLAYLGATLLVGWVVAIVLALAGSPLYSAYADAASRPGGISALTDQQLAAGVMWVPGGLPYLIALVLIAYRLLDPRRARPAAGAPANFVPKGV